MSTIGSFGKLRHMASWRRLAWAITLLMLALVAALTGHGIFLVWHRFPATDALTAWTALAGIGAIVTGLATAGLAAFALRGLRSLTMTRDEIIHRTARDARLQAIERLEELANKIIPMNTGVLEALARCKAGVYLQPGESPKFDPDPRDLSRAQAWVRELRPEACSRIVAFVNHLEAWSVYFTEGVADSRVAMGPAAPLLRAWVGQYFAVLQVLRSGEGPISGKFPNLVKLYAAWSATMDAEQLGLDHQEIVGQLEQVKERLARAKLPDATPKIGD